MLTRRANDGNFYTELEFQQWYGSAKGLAEWERAGAREPGAAGLLPEAQQPAAPPSPPAPPPSQQHHPAGGTAQQLAQPPAAPQTVADAPIGIEKTALPSAPTATDAPAGAKEPGTAGLAPILFAPSDMDRFRTQGARLGPDVLHNAARGELEHRIRIAHHAAGDTDPGENAVKFPWQPYVAVHPQANDLVGSGITSFEANFIAGTTDPNRSGQQRLDFVIRHTDGGYWRIHPGSKPRLDAVPRYFTPADARTHLAADQWRYLGPQGFTYEDALTVPQSDRIGKKKAWVVLENLPLGELDSSPDATFKWWLWLANLGPHTQTAIGAGVIGAALTFSDCREKRILCRRVDGCTVEMLFSRKEGITIAEQ